MFSFSKNDLTTKEKNKILIGTVVPRPIALVSTESEEGVVNIAPFSYFNIVTYKPAILSIAVQRTNGKQKDTARNITAGKEAVVHVVDISNVELANITAANLAPEDSELNYADFTPVKSVSVRPPGLKEAKARFETSLYDTKLIYDGDEPTADVLFLKIEHFHLDESVYDEEKGYIDVAELGAVSRLAGNDYAEIGRMFTIDRPK
ncbi:flavin reductase family protein [Jeotgalicoccus halotolerans]|uniref:Flavin reductase family protein n=1 Tax=Jeotgalicoccus nanhaiensis TaxID=568603 RepID=A0ABR9XXQ6_9STAP|nr:flavin reductase family protein [Jeotgalicoccus nanhaiensis]MBF0753790.1 flavin reductase family protein [Jeotgalicoccus nanhaiensis]TFU61952.1 flavin reductase family protein [Jeotgalicoccus nanhaiensis]